jgi:hypothetical protein
LTFINVKVYILCDFNKFGAKWLKMSNFGCLENNKTQMKKKEQTWVTLSLMSNLSRKPPDKNMMARQLSKP